jgi:hypothetical protein
VAPFIKRPYLKDKLRLALQARSGESNYDFLVILSTDFHAPCFIHLFFGLLARSGSDCPGDDRWTLTKPCKNGYSEVLSARQNKPNTLNQIASLTADVLLWEERDANNMNNQFYQVVTLIIVEEYVAFEIIIKASSGVGIRDKTVAYRGLEKQKDLYTEISETALTYK